MELQDVELMLVIMQYKTTCVCVMNYFFDVVMVMLCHILLLLSLPYDVGFFGLCAAPAAGYGGGDDCDGDDGGFGGVAQKKRRRVP